MTNEEFEPIRIRIMKEAYDLADKNDTEGYNSVKVMCSDIQNLMHRKPLTEDYDLDNVRYKAKYRYETKQPLTQEQIDVLCDAYLKCQEESPEMSGIYRLIRAVERAHGIGVEDE